MFKEQKQLEITIMDQVLVYKNKLDQTKMQISSHKIKKQLEIYKKLIN